MPITPKIKLDQYGGVITKPYEKREPKAPRKYAGSKTTPKEVQRLRIIAAAAQRAGDADGVAEAERAIREFYEASERKADSKDRKGKITSATTLVF